jgi:hypothetical protein
MAITYLLAPIPRWFFTDKTGKPLGAGYMRTFDSLNKTLEKPVFQDPAGANAWPNPVYFDENGMQGPFYWKVDSDHLDQTYYLEIYDKDGNFQFDIDHYNAPGSGGGSVVTTSVDIKNLLINNIFYRNIGETSTPIAVANTFLAPGAHTGLVLTSSNAGPDIAFIKDAFTATDTVSFVDFALGSNLSGDITPVQYMNYTCTLNSPGETTKFAQFPISNKVENLTNQNVTVTVWAKANSGASTLSLQWFQFFGDGGGPSAPVTTLIQNLSLTNAWAKYVIPTTVPNVSGKVLGSCGNDGLFLQIGYPLGLACNIDICKPSLYVGTINPTEDYISMDETESVINDWRTGDDRTSANTFLAGWVAANDGTIGLRTSLSSSNATTRANIDTFPLFHVIWSACSASVTTQAFAPMYDNLGNPVAYGASSIADFVAFRQLTLLKSLDRVVAGTAVGLPLSRTFTAIANPTNTLTLAPDATQFMTGCPVVLSNSGGALPTGLTAGTTYYVIRVTPFTAVIKLATSPENAAAGTAVTFTTVGTGTHTITMPVHPLGKFLGEENHTLTISEMPAHTHAPLSPGTNFITNNTGSATTSSGGNIGSSSTTASTGGGLPHNNMQPTTYRNRFVKL